MNREDVLKEISQALLEAGYVDNNYPTMPLRAADLALEIVEKYMQKPLVRLPIFDSKGFHLGYRTIRKWDDDEYTGS